MAGAAGESPLVSLNPRTGKDPEKAGGDTFPLGAFRSLALLGPKARSPKDQPQRLSATPVPVRGRPRSDGGKVRDRHGRRQGKSGVSFRDLVGPSLQVFLAKNTFALAKIRQRFRLHCGLHPLYFLARLLGETPQHPDREETSGRVPDPPSGGTGRVRWDRSSGRRTRVSTRLMPSDSGSSETGVRRPSGRTGHFGGHPSREARASAREPDWA